jgi:hypothetical protein
MMDFDHDRSQVTNRNKPKEKRHRRGIKRMHYLDEGGRICIGRLVDARMITALGRGRMLDPKSSWGKKGISAPLLPFLVGKVRTKRFCLKSQSG